MTRYAPQWLQSGSYSASQDRRLIAALWPAAASSGCQVVASTGMQVSVNPGQVAVPTQNNTGSSLCTSDAVEFVTLTAAPASGVNRIDLITCHPRGADLDGGANNDFIFDFVTGTAAATPTVPATPAGQVALANIYVPGGSAAVTAGNITDVRPGGLAIGGAAALPPPVTSGSAIQAYTDQNGEVWVAKNGVNGGAWKKARDVLHAKWYRAAAWTTSAASGSPVAFDTAAFDVYGLYSTGSVGFVAPVPGLYRMQGQAVAAIAAAGQFVQVAFVAAAVSYATPTFYHGAAANAAAVAGDTVKANAGDVLSMNARTTAAVAGAVGQTSTFLAVDYLGTG